MKLVLALLALVGLAACSSSSDDSKTSEPDISIPAQPNAIAFASTVSQDQAAALNETISALYVLPLTYSNPEVVEMAKLMNAPETSPPGLQAWLEDRVQYVVQDHFPDSSVTLADAPFTYQNPNVFPDILTQTQTPQNHVTPTADSSAQVMMSNIGAAYYVEGKALGKLKKVDVPGVGMISMTSPRTGLLEIGPGLFADGGGHSFQNIAIDIDRLGTLFHEARHSDGHGHTLGFMHTICPYGDYKGLAACDLATNGPYSVGAAVTKALMNECTSSGKCTDRSTQVLQAVYLDQADRVVEWSPSVLSNDARAGAVWDDTPEGKR